MSARNKNSDAFYFDTTGLDDYVRYLRTLNYKDIDREMKPVVRQVANKAKDIMKRHTPVRSNNYVDQANGNYKLRNTYQGPTGKYGATPGNLRRTIRVFVKRNKPGVFEVGASVGPKVSRHGELTRRIAAGKQIRDGYYWFFVNFGVAGKHRKKKNSSGSQGFIGRARRQANMTINAQLTHKSLRVIKRRLDKKLNRK